MPYLAAHPLEFQTLDQWSRSDGGLGPVETTMLVALPELDGAASPTVFAGRHGAEGCQGCAHKCAAPKVQKAMSPCPERIEVLSARVEKLVHLHRSERAARRVGIVIFGFPPNAGAVGTAAYLGVMESLYNTLNAMKGQGYSVDVPDSVDALRDAVLKGNKDQYGQQANVMARIPADRIVRGDPYLAEVEAQWGPAPGRAQSDGSSVFVLGAGFGNVFVGVQPAFAMRAIPCGSSLRRVSLQPMLSVPSIVTCAMISKPMHFCILACMAHLSSCPGSSQGHRGPAGRTG